MFLGYVCAVLILTFCQGNDPKWFFASVVIFALPILDTALAFVRRWVKGRPLFSADRYHLHHQLVARGFTIKQTVVISYALALGFVVLGASIVFVRIRFAVAIWLAVFGSIIVAAYKMGMIHERTETASPKPLDAGDVQAASGIEPGSVLQVPDMPATESGLASSKAQLAQDDEPSAKA
jgi:hypothetical protein